ncbi:uncharacterized protein PHACADRAFT_259985 [Phanerochaete carnosa HHB-10118-sp]|uniref:TEA domain-containing protein n=1 Tax=Phanerochaete carnosa (strain HHB-10118-sp) TaxID=650164 RepID=K5W343_PHACS|nr:uncharacterized protein PHACADRAFT_259985 [Phanerochaete carnosa HHB-10118-sp]EKM53560.1 hypothetical protein PHACADRAFT_259985 [Phanerochaete carnosa HHB-10118-sp]
MSPRQFHHKEHVQVSSMDDFSSTYSPSFSRGTNDAVQSIVTSRKCWKTIKGKGEVVWPPQLEAALVEGLERYRPVETRSARALGRFPMRNKFISDYIYQVTGKHRTPKQVGSRLQQLRDTCEGKRILKLLSHRPGSPRSPSVEHSTASPEPSTPSAPPRDYLNVDVLPADISWPSASASEAYPSSRPVRAISNTVTFRSSTAVHGESRSHVLKDGVVVHSETTELQMQSSSCMPAPYSSDMECVFLYTTKLVPHYWPTLCNATNIGSYSISQDIVARTSSSQGSEAESSQAPSERVLSSVVYQFNVPQCSPPSSPTSSNGDAYSYTTESSVGHSRELERIFGDAMSTVPTPMATHTSSPHYQQRYQLHPATSQSFDMSPPGLIRDEEGYQSLPQSPLDAVFPNTIALSAGLATGQFDSSAVSAGLAPTGARYGQSLAHPSQPGYSPF